MKSEITVENLKKQIENKLSFVLGVSPEEASDDKFYKAMALICKDILREINFENRKKPKNKKAVHYLSMEFLVGRSLKNNLYNLGLKEVAEQALEEYGVKLENLYEREPDAGLGNGGLGRLAACYLDALASGDYEGYGYSLLYEYGIFNQKIIDGWQKEYADRWLPGGSVWLAPKLEEQVTVKFGGKVQEFWDGHYHTSRRIETDEVYAVPYDMYISGYGGKNVAPLRLWKCVSLEMDMEQFNQGNYMKSVERDAMSEIITKVLYPSDNHIEGKILRLKQQYFLCSASIQDIVQKHIRKTKNAKSIPDKMVIHINDTHPALAIAELMRILLDDCGFSWDDAWSVTSKTFAYTNHTVLSEALESWPEELLEKVLPRIYQILREINYREIEEIKTHTDDQNVIAKTSIINNGMVKMANLSSFTAFKINGVSALHSEILKKDLFSDFYGMYPDKFENVTNGIAYRRWLCQSNPELSNLIKESIGDKFITDYNELEKLMTYIDDESFLRKLLEIKKHNKETFCNFALKKSGIELNPDFALDVQLKRLHEYKRQHLNALNIVADYLYIKDNPNANFQPRTYIFAAKAAPGYYIAKKIIEFIWKLGKMIDEDPAMKNKLKLVFLEDYNVTMAETLMPAAEISEQISLAGKEASGTGNMKLMINGAVTIGTMDGANVEISERVGEDNIYIFGMSAEQAKEAAKNYNPMEIYMTNPQIRRIIDFIGKEMGQYCSPDIENTKNYDPYMVLKDFDDYRRVHNKLMQDYPNEIQRAKKSLVNIAKAGNFSADRAIREYAEKIWKL
ncbi:MAG: glycogen/starch/alpha-glucan phosphorylase [Clostridia bacterium]|nr:glycogen/starch/alpha-glucan phosphorylase [Clostridia bacterium]